MLCPFIGVRHLGLCLFLFFLPIGAWAQSVLVAGGEISPGPPALYTNTAEVYNPANGTWTATLDLIPNAPPISVGGLCAPNMVLLGNRQVLLAGGGCTDQTQVGTTAGYTTNAASIYDPFSNNWTASTAMNEGRDQFGMVALNDGSALAFFGCSGGCLGHNILDQSFSVVGPSAEIYNFDTNQWTQEASFGTPIGNLSTGNLNQPAVVLRSGRVLACNGTDGNTTPFNTCEIYDPVGNSWSATGSLPANEFGIHQMALLNSGKVLTVSTVDGRSAFLFDPTSGTWSPTGSLAVAQFGGQLVVLSDGRVVDCGGTLADGLTPVNTTQTYDPTPGTWSTTGSMGFSRVGHIAVRLADGRVLVAGGKSSTILSSAEIFDPVAGSWSPTSSMMQARFQANALLVGNSCSVSTTEVGLTVNATVQCTGDFAAGDGNQLLTFKWVAGNPNFFTGSGSGGGASCGTPANNCSFTATSNCSIQVPAGGQCPPESVINPYPVAGTYTIEADVTDASGNTTSVFQTVKLGPIMVTVSPNPASVLAGTTQQFSANVTNATVTSVTWSAIAGNIDKNTGAYTAPANATTDTVKAVSNADGTSGQANVTVTDFSATLSSTGANVVPGGVATTTLTITSNGFTGSVSLSCPGIASGLSCSFNPAVLTVPAKGTVTSSVAISTSSTTPVGLYPITVAAQTTNPSATRSTQPFNLQVLTVGGCSSINPTSQSFGAPGGSGTIAVTSTCEGWTATSNADWITVTGGSSGSGNGAVTYSVAANTTTTQRTGTLTVAGLNFSVTQTGEVGVSISPNPPATVQAGTTEQFKAAVINTATTGVTWSVSGSGCSGNPCGTIDQNGLYTAPAALSAPQVDTLTATSAADSAATASVQVTVFPTPKVVTPPPAQTVAAGQPATYTITIAPNTGDPTQPTNLSCAPGLPNGVTCVFVPPAVTLGPNGATFVLTIQTTGGTALLNSPRGGSSMLLYASLMPFSGIVLFGIGGTRRKNMLATLAVLLICASMMFLPSCGTNGTFGTPPPSSFAATPAGSYTIVIRGQTAAQANTGVFTMLTNVSLTVH